MADDLVPTREHDGADPAPPALEWAADPIDLALVGSTKAGAREPLLPTPFCVEVGRRLLRAELDFQSWVLRRVETVSLEEGRSVLRRMTIEFKVRDDAPAFVVDADEDTQRESFWMVPLAVMKRRTLVDFQLSDEGNSPLTLPGLRLTQALDESVLLAAAATFEPPGDEVREFVREVVSGDHQVVTTAMRDYYRTDRWGAEVAGLRQNKLFSMTLQRLRFNFTLYVLLRQRPGRHRLLNMSFVEPVSWRYQYGNLYQTPARSWIYEPNRPALWTPRHLWSALGLTPTRVRLQVPAAENAASYHLEVIAPQGVRIVEAALLAGRPHVDDSRFSLDRIRGDSLTVGLHAVEVPPNSLCRAQVDLRVQTAGWLTTLLMATLAILLVLASVTWHAFIQKSPDPGQDTNVIVLLITTAAAAATFVAQRDFGGVAARLVTGMRAVGAISMALPILAAGFLSYHEATDEGSTSQSPAGVEVSTRVASAILTGAALLLFLLVLLTWLRTRRDERREAITSPWDMSVQARRRQQARGDPTYNDANHSHGFDSSAVAVRSSEGWHHIYRWTDVNQENALAALDRLHHDRMTGPYPCPDHRCPLRGADPCLVRQRKPGKERNGD